MKILNKLFLFLAMSWNLFADANFYSVFNTLQRAGLYVGAASRLARPALDIGMEYKKFESLPQVSQEVFDFCKKRFELQGVKTDALQIKVQENYCDFVYVVDSRKIVFSQRSHDDLKNVLQDPTKEKNHRAILVYMFMIDHEVGHIKNNDSVKRRIFLIGSNLLTFAGAYYLMNHSSFKNWFATPTNFRGFLLSLVAFKSFDWLFSANDAVNGLYDYAQEIAADKNAIKYAKDPQSLRSTARFFEKLDEVYVKALCVGEINSNCSLVTKKSFEAIHGMLVAKYKEQKITEDFESWVKTQTNYLILLKLMVDKEHPSGALRSKYLNAAADVLENKMLVV